MRDYSKHLPSDQNIQKDQLTFLTDKKVDERLQGQFMSISKVLEKEGKVYTVVWKQELPTLKDLCAAIHCRSSNTQRAHLKQLVEQEQLFDLGDQWVINTEKEDQWVDIPVDTLEFMTCTCTEDVIKVYVFLRAKQRGNQNGYNFSLKELAEHTGVSLSNNMESQVKLNHILTSLSNNGLIEIKSITWAGKPQMRLIQVNENYMRLV